MKLSFPKVTSIFVMSMSLYSCESASDSAKKRNINPVPAVVAKSPPKAKDKAKEFLHIALDTTLEKFADIVSGEDTEEMIPV
ncbi:hypothetical protein AP064_04420 [Candidatus Liberibacter solanacearum]|uniref:hypothetical protein n=1 Tax=Candidatus Liberibacter solanacearum TaxID=556287 RepID=UPI0005FA7F76|nr:hypothetical protein [Candidatus Liberibacter solanacearum]KJZ80696.1 hypothetical protein KP07_02130 [Candidatus Liberibacter solanacearum]KQC48840.1 hypothetical protein AP064_04420 [Candidatus Liberibacter solanacearum]